MCCSLSCLHDGELQPDSILFSYVFVVVHILASEYGRSGNEGDREHVM